MRPGGPRREPILLLAPKNCPALVRLEMAVRAHDATNFPHMALVDPDNKAKGYDIKQILATSKIPIRGFEPAA